MSTGNQSPSPPAIEGKGVKFSCPPSASWHFSRLEGGNLELNQKEEEKGN